MNTTTVLHSNPDSSDVSMSSVEIAEVTGKNHSHVLRDIRSMLSQLYGAYPKMDGSDIKGVFEELRQDNGQTKAFYLDREHAECLVTGYSAQLRMKVIRRLRELEEQVAKPDPMQALNDPATMRGLLLSYSEKVLEQERALQEAAPKVEFANRVEVAHDAITVGEAAKIIGTGRTRLFAFLRRHGWVNRRNEPYQPKIEAGLMDVKISHWEHPEQGLKENITALVTGKGLVRLQKLWDQESGVAA